MDFWKGADVEAENCSGIQRCTPINRLQSPNSHPCEHHRHWCWQQ